MAITKKAGRQEVILATSTFALADLVSGTAVAAIDLPSKARVINTLLRIDTAFNSGTTDALVVQSNEGTPKAYITIAAAAGSLAAGKVWSGDPGLAGTASSNTAFVNPVVSTIDIKWTGAGTVATTGSGVLLVEYIRDDRAEFSQG
jgi:hypothetical protein